MIPKTQDLAAQEKRKQIRYRFHWPVAITTKGDAPSETFEGATHDISLAGCSALLDDNIEPGNMINVRLFLPLAKVGATREIVEIDARVVYTILPIGGTKFRCGIEFLQFRENSRKLLERAIELRIA